MHRIEPVKSLRFGAIGDALTIVTLAETPETNAVEVVQTDSLGNGVDNGGIGNRFGEDVRQVDVDEVDAGLDASSASAADLDEDQEDDGQEE